MIGVLKQAMIRVSASVRHSYLHEVSESLFFFEPFGIQQR